MGDEEMGNLRPVFALKFLHEVDLDESLRPCIREPEPTADAHDVRIHGDAFVNAERSRKHDRRSLAADTSECQHLLHRLRNVPAKITEQGAAGLLNRSGFNPKCPAGMNVLFQRSQRHYEIVLRPTIFPEK